MMKPWLWWVAMVVAGLPAAAPAQQRPSAQSLMAAQKQALSTLAWMDGEWRGPAQVVGMDGKPHSIVQTERIGPLLDGSIKLVEGRGYDADGSVGFGAFAVLSYDPAAKVYHFQSHAMGHSGDFALVPTATGFSWSIPAGPMTIRYTVTHENGEWHEVGERVMPDQPPVQIYDAHLRRIGASAWPAAGTVSMH